MTDTEKQAKPLETWTPEELTAAVRRLSRWARKRGHSATCWGNEDPRQCGCGLCAALADIPETE
jgi:hypothetical protein